MVKDALKPDSITKVTEISCPAEAAWEAEEDVHAFPPQPRAAPVPEVPTPAPRIIPLVDRWADRLVGAQGETPKFPLPPGCEEASQAASVPEKSVPVEEATRPRSIQNKDTKRGRGAGTGAHERSVRGGMEDSVMRRPSHPIHAAISPGLREDAVTKACCVVLRFAETVAPI